MSTMMKIAGDQAAEGLGGLGVLAGLGGGDRIGGHVRRRAG
jgi:hypothetical protein